MITVSNLTHRIAGKDILHDISLQIPKGQITALIGPNGAGKSTLLSAIARLTPHQTGQIMVDELEVGTSASNTLAKRLSILPQVPEIAPRLSVAELIGFGRYPYHKGHPTKVDRQKTDEAIVLFELDELHSRPLDTLSGGQKQRALLAMTYAQDTEYMLLDEPLNNLDISTSRSLMQLLRRLAETRGRTVVIVLHDINYACSYADRIVTMKDGRIGRCGAPAKIVDAGMLQHVFSTQAEVHIVNGRPLIEV
ncbi:ABC transporter ATP-binding protein [uncultured Roseovarius sp.]|uniref:iron ABC transporter ATP-binding protein n=1 Tax=uncultured Roseovarius sp. TaxID=293344 RepID=UPI00260B82E2|nr:ATP-binding cassette domain-containing protein [uncultured Roseovarius sp.]